MYANLIEELGGPDATLLKGVYRRTWYANQLVLAQVRRLLDRLRARDVASSCSTMRRSWRGTTRISVTGSFAASTYWCAPDDWQSCIAAATEEGWQAEPASPSARPPRCRSWPFQVRRVVACGPGPTSSRPSRRGHRSAHLAGGSKHSGQRSVRADARTRRTAALR